MTTIVCQSVSLFPFNDGDLSAFQADGGKVLLAVLQEVFFITAVAEIVVNATKASFEAGIIRGVLGQDVAEFNLSVFHFVFHSVTAKVKSRVQAIPRLKKVMLRKIKNTQH